jgi:hypothetical protein
VLCLELSIQRHVGADFEISQRLNGTHRVRISNYLETNSAYPRAPRIFNALASLQTQCMQLGTQRKCAQTHKHVRALYMFSSFRDHVAKSMARDAGAANGFASSR